MISESFHKEKRISHEEICKFAEYLRLNEIIPGRYSTLLVLQIYEYMELFGLHPEQVIEEIKILEGQISNRGTKPDTSFSHPPLKGLRHKHFFSAGSIPMNILNEIKSGRLNDAFAKAIELSRTSVDPMGVIKELTNKVVHGTIESRQKERKLTGEWIIFAKHDDQNYYLAIATHNTPDQQIYDQISKMCFAQFPFLVALLTKS